MFQNSLDVAPTAESYLTQTFHFQVFHSLIAEGLQTQEPGAFIGVKRADLALPGRRREETTCNFRS